jgi:hypothetical protein
MAPANPFVAYVDCGNEYGVDLDVREYLPEGYVLLDRARFERLLAVAEAAYEDVNAPYDVSAGAESLALKAERALTELVDALQPGDLDPLP